jgi:hypothetical protein
MKTTQHKKNAGNGIGEVFLMGIGAYILIGIIAVMVGSCGPSSPKSDYNPLNSGLEKSQRGENINRAEKHAIEAFYNYPNK